MELSPLQLEGYYVKGLQFLLRPSIEEEANFSAPNGLQFIPHSLKEIDPLTINISGGGGPKEDDITRWRFNLLIKADVPSESNYPYEFSIEIEGFFKVLFSAPLGKDEKALRVNAMSLLFSTAREVIATATSRGPYPAVLLPSVSFANSPFAERKEEGMKEKADKETSTSKPKARSSKSKVKTEKKNAAEVQTSKSSKKGERSARRSQKEKSGSKKKK